MEALAQGRGRRTARLKGNNSAGMETSSDTFKLKIPRICSAFPLRFLPIITKSVQIVEEVKKMMPDWSAFPQKKEKTS